MAVIWSAASGASIEHLNRLQKRAARIICTDYDTPSVDMFKNLGGLSMPDRLNYNEALLTYRAIHNMSPDYISNLVRSMFEIHMLNLRSSPKGLLYVPKARTALFESSFSCYTIRLFNTIPQTVKMFSLNL